MRKIKLIGLVLVLVLSISACAQNEQDTVVEECAVYTTIINSLYGNGLVAIMDMTVPADLGGVMEEKFIQKNLETLIETKTIQNYVNNNHKIYKFDPENCLGNTYIRINEEEHKRIFSRGDGWGQFSVLYPESLKVLMTFSKIGFNSQMDQALVFVQSYGDYGSGEGFYILLRKSGENWKIEKSIIAWLA